MAKMTLAAARVNAGKSQRRAAAELNVAPNTISRWERGKTYPSTEKLSAIQECYGVSIGDIIFLPRNNA